MSEIPASTLKKRTSLGYRIGDEFKRNYILYIMTVPVLVYFILFVYLPMFGIVIAFQNYVPAKGILGSDWVGFAHFKDFLTDDIFPQVLKNTLLINFYMILFGFPAPIIFALMLNEIKNLKYKKAIQTVTYLPHFISLVVICGMVSRFFTSDGILTSLISLFGGDKINYMIEQSWFRRIYVGSEIWQTIGWNSIIYVSALSSIDQELYEAATIDGAGKWQQLLHITLPGIASTAVVLFIMTMGGLLSVGYEKVLLLQSPQTANVARVINSYVYEIGLGSKTPIKGALSYSSAVGLFSSVVNIICLIVTNVVSKKISGTGLF